MDLGDIKKIEYAGGEKMIDISKYEVVGFEHAIRGRRAIVILGSIMNIQMIRNQNIDKKLVHQILNS